MKERPILFSAPMVRAILDGTKTQTRRVVRAPAWSTPERAGVDYPCPHGAPGDRLWVRETWNRDERNENALFYSADYAIVPHDLAHTVKPALYPSCKPSIHMPRWASRITLELTDVRVERVQDITEADALAEGVTLGIDGETGRMESGVKAYRRLWDSINAARGYGWAVNPWVWVISFQNEQESQPCE